MSTSLLKQSLEIVESTLPKSNTDKKTRNKNPFNHSLTNEPSPKPSITNRNGKINKKKNNDKVNKRKQQNGSGKKSAIQQAHERIKNSESKIEETLQKLLMFSSVKLSDTTTNKIIRRAQNKKYILPEQKPEEESTSVFTEEDFAKFEREYFIG